MNHQELEKYKDSLDSPMEELGVVLSDIGWKGSGVEDSKLVDVAAKKLKVLHRMLLASGMKKVLDAVMLD